MIVFVVTREHAYTLRHVKTAVPDLEVRIVDYGAFLAAKQFPRAAYILSDLERLALWQREAAAALCRALRQDGMTVLNDPARGKTRHGLLRQLHLAGINSFNAYRVEEGLIPRRWPVFLRLEGDHRGPRSELLPDWPTTQRHIHQAMAEGLPVAGMLVVEYCAEPIAEGLYRKLSMFRLGQRSFGHRCVHEDHWVAKHGKPNLASPELYAEELCYVRDNPYRETVERAFAIAGIDYGRADFGIVKGRVEIYEINDNPEIRFWDEDESSPLREPTEAVFRENFCAALRAIDHGEEASEALAL